jgi:hypothetical protein
MKRSRAAVVLLFVLVLQWIATQPCVQAAATLDDVSAVLGASPVTSVGQSWPNPLRRKQKTVTDFTDARFYRIECQRKFILEQVKSLSIVTRQINEENAKIVKKTP